MPKSIMKGKQNLINKYKMEKMKTPEKPVSNVMCTYMPNTWHRNLSRLLAKMLSAFNYLEIQ